MSLSIIKSTIANAVKPIQICEDYQDILIATDQDELLKSVAAKDQAEWAWSVGIITPELMAMFDDALLVSNNYFNTGSHTLTNPGSDVYVLGDADVSIISSGFNRCRIVLMSNSASVHINGSDEAHIKLLRKKCSVTVEVTLTDNASFIGDIEGDGIVDVTASNDSVFHARTFDNTIINYSGYDNAVAVIKAKHKSQIDVLTGESNNVIITKIDKEVKVSYVDNSAL